MTSFVTRESYGFKALSKYIVKSLTGHYIDSKTLRDLQQC
jgi:hypothetical protein